MCNLKKNLEVKQLNKEYAMDGNKTYHMLKNINLEIYEGEFISVMGPSGSGKSTLLYNISGMDQMSSGSVKVDSKEITCMKEEVLAKLRTPRVFARLMAAGDAQPPQKIGLHQQLTRLCRSGIRTRAGASPDLGDQPWTRLTIVTGGAGFIGSHLVERLVARGERVRVVERPGADTAHLPAGVEVVRADIRDRAAVARRCAGAGGSTTWRPTRTSGPATAASSTRSTTGGRSTCSTPRSRPGPSGSCTPAPRAS